MHPGVSLKVSGASWALLSHALLRNFEQFCSMMVFLKACRAHTWELVTASCLGGETVGAKPFQEMKTAFCSLDNKAAVLL